MKSIAISVHIHDGIRNGCNSPTDGKNINHLSGNGVAGFSDGDLTDATFNHPRSFAVDSKGNIYVADKNNHAIRKISKSGVTTIAGGSSSKTGNVDGPAQNATFSTDFDLTFIPKTCVLLISDRGNSLIRQIYLKAEDCAHESRLELGVPLVCVVGVLCLLVGSIVGFVVRPFLTSRDISSHNDGLNKILKHCRTNLKGQVQIACSDIRNAVARSTPFMLLSRLVMLGLSDVFLIFEVFRPRKVVNPSQHAEPISLLDSDIVGNTEKQQDFADQLEDLVSFDDALKMEKSIERGDGDEKGDTSTLDKMIEDNILCFSNPTMKQEGLLKGVLGGSIGLAKRRGIEADNGH
ncbi:uncharacterized protein LOC131257943 isoform X2 [Magnolia sinica]|uniref:uncharacterized protein LOC131257943 isoform X2 n=1 Tax=Magnolia sinica TaxID=86752 RepID=UPI00265AD396|nr:uncharacterized protein LOC131257943 isoform X2 [Magnolia sinica]